MQTSTFENFPWWMITISNAVSLAVYALGLFLLFHLGTLWGLLFAAYCLGLEWRLLSQSCRSCYYYGKRCGFGKGRVCSWFLTKRPQQPFSSKKISWLDIVPDFLVSLIPAAAGVAMLIHDFTWGLLLAVAALVSLGTVGTGFVRGQIVCKYCKQRELGCPAEQLFSKTK